MNNQYGYKKMLQYLRPGQPYMFNGIEMTMPDTISGAMWVDIPQDYHSENICQTCGGFNPIWSANNDLFNKVNGSPNGIICPTCFIKKANDLDIEMFGLHVKDLNISQCNICGGSQVLIRGKYPKMDKRAVCPTCSYERLEQINEISHPDYGKPFQNKS